MSLQRLLAYQRPYTALFRIRLHEGLQYRVAAWAGASTSIFWALIEITMFTVFYTYAENREAGFMAGLSLRQVVSYVWIGQTLFMMQLSLDPDLLAKIEDGDVAVEMCRPLDLYNHWLARTVANRLTPLVWRGSFVLLAGMLIPGSYGLGAPASWLGLILACISAFSALCLSSAYCMVVYAVRMRVDWGNGPMHLLLLVSSVLSGSYLPLQLWPESLQTFLLLQPFAGYLDIPARLFVGSLPPEHAYGPMLLQWIWVIIFAIAGRWLLHRRLQSMIVQGG